jgi:hypothetical protein
MKLAEALVLRADLQKRIEGLRTRLQRSVLVQEGLQPPEASQELFAELGGLLEQLTTLIPRINRTNLAVTLADQTSLMVALARRDVLKLQISVLTSAAEATVTQVNRYSRSEIRSVPTIDVGVLRRQIDDLARQHRELDTAIQAVNWATDLLD